MFIIPPPLIQFWHNTNGPNIDTMRIVNNVSALNRYVLLFYFASLFLLVFENAISITDS